MFEFLGEKLQLWGSSISARTKHRSQSSAVRRKIEDLEPVVDETYTKLGTAFYEAAKDDVPEQFSSYFKVITDALREIELNKAELERLSSVYEEKKQELEEKRQDVKMRQKEEAARKKEEARKRREEETLQKEELSQLQTEDPEKTQDFSGAQAELFENTSWEEESSGTADHTELQEDRQEADTANDTPEMTAIDSPADADSSDGEIEG